VRVLCARDGAKEKDQEEEGGEDTHCQLLQIEVAGLV
jgi:hypothetical protein